MSFSSARRLNTTLESQGTKTKNLFVFRFGILFPFFFYCCCCCECSREPGVCPFSFCRPNVSYVGQEVNISTRSLTGLRPTPCRSTTWPTTCELQQTNVPAQKSQLVTVPCYTKAKHQNISACCTITNLFWGEKKTNMCPLTHFCSWCKNNASCFPPCPL